MNSGFHECLAEGVTLFNSGQWYEAHEVWEEAWKRESGPRRVLLQGLILVAAGWVQRSRGRHEGARVLFGRGIERLELLPAAYEGVEVGVLLPQVRQWREGGTGELPRLPFTPPQED